jgi:hypothetical protein
MPEDKQQMGLSIQLFLGKRKKVDFDYLMETR